MIVEIDFADILFAYGILGLLYFIALMFFLIIQALRFSNARKYPYSNFILLMILTLLGISTTAGHVYSSGMAALFIGLLFALMYFKKDEQVEINKDLLT
jgi:heme A synthase